MSIDVITAAIPERVDTLLPEAIRSVAVQTFLPGTHLVGVDHAKEGSAVTRNNLLAAASADWVAVLDDDDLLRPDHLAVLAAAAVATGADVVYSDCDGHVPPGANADFDGERLRRGNFIPATAMYRRELALSVGGYPEIYSEDYALWLLLLGAGAKFHHVAQVTWTYRRHDGWTKSAQRTPVAHDECVPYGAYAR